MPKRSLIAALAAVAAMAIVVATTQTSLFHNRRPPGKFSQRLVVLGFDGMDPALTGKWMREGRLPNLKRLAAQGGMYPLSTTQSPESPTAWSSFATGVNPGKHNIFDFLVRDAATYLPDLGMIRREPGRFLFDYFPYAKPKLFSLRGATSFWVTAGRAGVRSTVLTVPVTFPPEEVPNGELLSGLPLPDIRGTMGTFYYFGTDLDPREEGNTQFGGILKRLVFDRGVARSEIVGPPSPIAPQRKAAEDLTIPFAVRWNRSVKSATIEIAGQSLRLEPGVASRWIDLDFRVNLLVRLHGMAQLQLLRADDELRLYVSPINWKPDNPPLPISSPSSFSGDLFERLGHFRTLGWAEATWPLTEGRIDEKTFMDDLYRAFDDRAQVILSRIDSRDWDLLVGVIESTDRVQHVMWRFLDPKHPMYDAALAAAFGDSIERVYRRADQFVGEVLEHVDPGTTVMVVSDHGFHSWRKAVNLNTWLAEQGYMVLRGQAPAEKTLDDLFGGGAFWENVDWDRTRAYAMGLGQIYLNVRGRERQGIVNPGTPAAQLAEEIASKLLTLHDPDDGTRIVRAVYRREAVYSGPYVDNAAELQVGMEEGYRVSWQTALGGAPQGIVHPNRNKWSGDHGGFDYTTTAGVLISNKPVGKGRTGSLSIMDIAPTVLRYFGIPVPAEIDGKPLY
jgi:predicted AlkP superfamily phosphohydrolase/phosphomutase